MANLREAIDKTAIGKIKLSEDEGVTFLVKHIDYKDLRRLSLLYGDNVGSDPSKPLLEREERALTFFEVCDEIIEKGWHGLDGSELTLEEFLENFDFWGKSALAFAILGWQRLSNDSKKNLPLRVRSTDDLQNLSEAKTLGKKAMPKATTAESAKAKDLASPEGVATLLSGSNQNPEVSKESNTT